MIPKYMIEFANELQFMVVRSLKRKGSSIKKGKFSVSLKVENYIMKNYKITKRLQLSSILNDLKINQSLIKDINDQNQSVVSNFKTRLGKHRKINYTVPCGSKFVQNASSLIHWEFIRVVRMAEEKDEAFVTSWNRLHKARFSKLSKSIKK